MLIKLKMRYKKIGLGSLCVDLLICKNQKITLE